MKYSDDLILILSKNASDTFKKEKKKKKKKDIVMEPHTRVINISPSSCNQ